MAGEATPDEIPPVPAVPGGISGFTGQIGASGPALPIVPPPAVLGIGPQPAALPPGLPTGPLSGQGFAALQIHNLDAQGRVAGAEAENQAAHQAALADITGAGAAKYAQQHDAEKAAWDATSAQVKARNEQLAADVAAAAAQKVDPNRLWANKSTGAKVLAGLGVALGAAGASLGHGQNTAMQIFQGAIDADIAAQKDNIANSWKGVQEKHGLDNDEQTRAQHAAAYEASHSLAGLKLIELQGAQMAAKTSSQTVKNNFDSLKIALSDKAGAIQAAQTAAQMAAQAGASAKAEKLAGEARAMYGKLVEKEGADPAAVQKVVDSQYPMLKGTAYASEGQRAEQRNDLAAQTIARQTVLASNGAVTLDQALKAARVKVEEANPAYGASAGGALNTPAKMREERAQLGADMEELQRYKKDAATISPSLIEGVGAEARGKVSTAQDQYRAFVYRQVAKMYKIDTGANEPKNLELIQHLAAPYMPKGAYEPVPVTRGRMDALEHDLHISSTGARGEGGAPAAGVSKPGAAPFVPSAPVRAAGADPFVPAGAAIPAPAAAPPAVPRERAPAFRQ